MMTDEAEEGAKTVGSGKEHGFHLAGSHCRVLSNAHS